jgi:carbamoyl-phosphate synthase large subunit
VAVYGIEELYRELPQFRYPVVVKGKFYEAYVAQNEEQAVGYFYKLSAKWGTPIILQQLVKGQEVNVTAIGDGTGRLMGAVPMRKTYITATGKGWAGIALDAPDLMALARTIVEGTRWPGGMEIELIREDGTDTLYLIEINPRFPAWVYLAVGCGQNHPEAVVRLAMGDTDVEPFTDHEVGKMFIRYSWDMICDLGEFEQISTAGEL